MAASPSATRQVVIVLDATRAMVGCRRALIDQTIGPLLDEWLSPGRSTPLTECAVLTVRDEPNGSGSVSSFTRSAATLRRWLDAVPLDGGMHGPAESLEALLLVARAAPWASRDRHVLLVTASAPLPLPDCTEPETEPWSPVPLELAAAQVGLSVLSPTALVYLASLHEACALARSTKPQPANAAGFEQALLLAPSLASERQSTSSAAAAAAAAAAANLAGASSPAAKSSASTAAAAAASTPGAALSLSLSLQRAASPGIPSPLFPLGAPLAADPRARTPSPTTVGGMTKLWEGGLLLPRPGPQGADELCRFKVGSSPWLANNIFHTLEARARHSNRKEVN